MAKRSHSKMREILTLPIKSLSLDLNLFCTFLCNKQIFKDCLLVYILEILIDFNVFLGFGFCLFELCYFVLHIYTKQPPCLFQANINTWYKKIGHKNFQNMIVLHDKMPCHCNNPINSIDQAYMSILHDSCCASSQHPFLLSLLANPTLCHKSSPLANTILATIFLFPIQNL